MTKHTTLNLDTDLVDEARSILGTSGTTETIHEALREVIGRRKRMRLLDYDFSSLTPESLAKMRENRIFPGPHEGD